MKKIEIERIKPFEAFMTIINKNGTQLYDRVTRSTGLAKTSLHGTGPGGRLTEIREKNYSFPTIAWLRDNRKTLE